MIDIATEEIFPLNDAPKHLPPRRGKVIHVSTIHRWVQRGLKGIRLEVVQVGGSRHTSLPALQRFFDRLGDPNTRPAVGNSASRDRAFAAAENELTQAGI